MRLFALNASLNIHVYRRRAPGYLIKVVPFTRSPQNKSSSAKFLVCFNFQSAPMFFKVGKMSNSLDLSSSASHPDPSFLHMGL